MNELGWRLKIEQFAESIGLSVRFQNRRWKSEFLPGIRVWRGSLLVDENRVLGYGDVFHEMGHLAVLPSCMRRYASGDIDGSLSRRIDRYFNVASYRDDDQTMRALLQSGEVEATAWAYAAMVECGLAPELRFVIQDIDEWRPATPDEIETEKFILSQGNHFGVHGLQAAGMTNKREYPKMIRWIQP